MAGYGFNFEHDWHQLDEGRGRQSERARQIEKRVGDQIDI